MKDKIEKAKTPEEKELNDKISELNSLETELAQKELDLATLMAELQALDSRYLRIVGAKFLELDQIKAEIAEYLATQQPENFAAQEEAKQARERADQTARDTGDISEPKKVEAFEPTKEIRELYREIAKKIHPDLAIDEKDRERRTKVMAEVNQAYREGDYERLETILREWETSPEAIEGEDVGSRLVRTIRMIARVSERINQIEQEFQRLHSTPIYELKIKVEEASSQGRDLFMEMVEQVEIEIEEAREHLNSLKAGQPG
ncbi:MAG: hypothetical protein P8Z41_09545 [Anaerolineales bacterium]